MMSDYLVDDITQCCVFVEEVKHLVVWSHLMIGGLHDYILPIFLVYDIKIEGDGAVVILNDSNQFFNKMFGELVEIYCQRNLLDTFFLDFFQKFYFCDAGGE